MHMSCPWPPYGATMSEVHEADPNSPPKGERRVEDLPGRRGLPLLGNLLQFDIGHAPRHSWRVVDEHGDFYRIGLATRTALQFQRRSPSTDPQGRPGGLTGSGSVRCLPRYRNQRRGLGRRRRLEAPAQAGHAGAQDQSSARVRGRWIRSPRRCSGAGNGPHRRSGGRAKRPQAVHGRRHHGPGLRHRPQHARRRRRCHPALSGKLFPVLARRKVAPFRYWRYLRWGADRKVDVAMQRRLEVVQELVDTARCVLRDISPPRAPVCWTRWLPLAAARRQPSRDRRSSATS